MRNSSIDLGKGQTSQSGIALIEILISVGILSVMVTASMSLLSSIGKGQTELTLKSELQSLQTETRMVIASNWNCSKNFNNVILPLPQGSKKVPLNKVDIYDSLGAIVSNHITAKQPHGKLLVNSIALDNVVQLEPLSYKVDLTVDAQPSTAGYVIRKFLSIPLRLTTDAANKIISCDDLTTNNTINVATLCTDLGGTLDPQGKCKLPTTTTLAGVTCPAGKALSGFSANGTPNCVTVSGGGGAGGGGGGGGSGSGGNTTLAYDWSAAFSGTVANTLADAKTICSSQGKKVPTVLDFSNDKTAANNQGTTLKDLYNIPGQLFILDNSNCTTNSGAYCDFMRPAADTIGSYPSDSNGVLNSGSGAYVACI